MKFNMDILPVLKEVFYSQNLKFFDVKIDENSQRSFHMGSHLLFAKVSIIDQQENAREIPLAVKVGKTKLDSSMVATGCRESAFFREIVPIFNKLQTDLKIKNIFNKIPKCYRTLMKDGYEIIILENLSFSGWGVIDSFVSLNAEGQEVIAKNIAQYHALSFALRHIDKQTFDKHATDFNMTNREVMVKINDVFQDLLCKIIENTLEETNKQEMLSKFRILMKNVNEQTMLNIVDDLPKEVVVVHGDLHKFNLMYKFKDKSSGSIVDAMFIDFQDSRIHSPVLDLTYYFFFSVQIPFKASDFLKYYHQELTTYLRDLTCDANKLFPYSTLIEHWNKYAFYGFCCGVTYVTLEFAVGTLQKPSNGTIESVEEPVDMDKTIRNACLNPEVTNNGLYKQSLINLTENYLESINIQ
ncbi:uncharacterized protein LOC114330472 [Diabrotica virgifera virgifera]|uniref:Uncharacterized protein LOC114330472 isoform X1 n=2 Tax=Diabrotica virgifera virgifera TaxID=50390 RepID=A0A6P7FKU0_DIAVI|nr:uncharacterized protein LOC114330472 [Diabrotica virgifera virgifera]